MEKVGLKGDQNMGFIQDTIKDLDNYTDFLLDLRSEVGTQLKRLEAIKAEADAHLKELQQESEAGKQ